MEGSYNTKSVSQRINLVDLLVSNDKFYKKKSTSGKEYIDYTISYKTVREDANSNSKIGRDKEKPKCLIGK